jgi:hypothetical protein
MFSDKECEILKAFIEEEILDIELRSHESEFKVMNEYLFSLGSIREKLEVLTAENVEDLFIGAGR